MEDQGQIIIGTIDQIHFNVSAKKTHEEPSITLSIDEYLRGPKFSSQTITLPVDWTLGPQKPYALRRPVWYSVLPKAGTKVLVMLQPDAGIPIATCVLDMNKDANDVPTIQRMVQLESAAYGERVPVQEKDVAGFPSVPVIHMLTDRFQLISYSGAPSGSFPVPTSSSSKLLHIGTTLASVSTSNIEGIPTELVDGSWSESHQYQNSAGIFGQLGEMPDCEGDSITAAHPQGSFMCKQTDSDFYLLLSDPLTGTATINRPILINIDGSIYYPMSIPGDPLGGTPVVQVNIAP